MNLKILLTIVLMAAATAKADPPAIHGMFLFGDKVTYVSHLPMFHVPHNYQLIMKVGLTDTDATVIKNYDALKASGKTEFTIAPQTMDLTKVMSGEITTFSAKLFDGHFEKGGKFLGTVNVSVEKILISAKLDSTDDENHKYFVFGENNEYFAAHLIQAKPSYDTIVKVSTPYELFQSHCRTRVCDSIPIFTPIDDLLPVTLPKVQIHENGVPKVGDQLGTFRGLLTDVLQVLYFEHNELSH